MTTIKCVGFSKAWCRRIGTSGFDSSNHRLGYQGWSPMVRCSNVCRVPRVWLESVGTSDFDSGPDPPMVRRSNVSGSEGLVPAARHQRFRLGFEPGSAPSIERSQGADLGECASRSSLLSCELQVEGWRCVLLGGLCAPAQSSTTPLDPSVIHIGGEDT